MPGQLSSDHSATGFTMNYVVTGKAEIKGCFLHLFLKTAHIGNSTIQWGKETKLWKGGV